MIRKSKIKIILSLFFLVVIFFTARFTTKAQDVSVTAKISDTQPPTVPILIEPSDGALLSDNTPSFKWYESTDNAALSHYSFYLNNSLVYNNIPLVDTENSNYLLDYDALNGTYTLTPKNSLSDRSYTWKIVAVDYANLSASSDIWDFTIDTLAPSFVLQKIGDTTVSISAGNPGSVPSSPIVIFENDATANEPVLVADGEANSSVKLTVTIPDDPTQTFTTNINTDGDYELKLGILPRDTDIRLDFIITDQVGHVSILEKVYFRIALQYWPTATPTSTLTPTPSISSSPTPIVSVSPTLSTTVTLKPSTSVSPKPSTSVTPQPTGLIPIIPPKEVVHEIGDELIELLPESLADQIKSFLRSELWLNLAPLLGLLFLLGFYILAFFLLLSKFIRDLSFKLSKKILFLLFPMFFKAKKNLVFEYRDTTASPLVKVELLDENNQVLDFAITNLQGNFNDFYKPQGRWHLQVQDPNFYYPIGDQRPEQLEFWHFYQNQLFDETNYHNQAILIPTLRAAGQEKLPFWERLRIFVLYLLDYPLWFLILSFLISLILLMRYEGLLNGVAVFFYIIVFLYKTFFLDKKAKTLTLVSELENQQQFSGNLITSLCGKDGSFTQSAIIPFEFSRSQLIKHSLTDVKLTVFAQDYALIQNGMVIDSQAIALFQNNEEVSISLKDFAK